MDTFPVCFLFLFRLSNSCFSTSSDSLFLSSVIFILLSNPPSVVLKFCLFYFKKALTFYFVFLYIFYSFAETSKKN